MSRRAPHPKQLKNGADYHVDVPAHLGMILDVHQRTLNSDSPWLFQTTNGTPFSHEHVQGEFKRLLKLAGLDDPRFDFTPHSMRHTFATLHILNGRPAKWVSEQLAHADATVTLKIYARWFKMACPAAADDHRAALLGAGVPLDGNEMATPSQPGSLDPRQRCTNGRRRLPIAKHKVAVSTPVTRSHELGLRRGRVPAGGQPVGGT